MLRVDHLETMNWDAAIRGMRNPLNSWDKMDSHWGCVDKGGSWCTGDCGPECTGFQLKLGPNDLGLMTKLRRAGRDHRKFMRMLIVSCDIVAPLYWWKEFDTYKIGTVCNSCSTMHKIHSKEFTKEDFSYDHLIGDDGGVWDENGSSDTIDILEKVIEALNACRQKFLETKDKKWWYQMIQLLPSTYNQKRTIMMNYEVCANIYEARHNHKLDEWHVLCDAILALPYAKELIVGEEDLK